MDGDHEVQWYLVRNVPFNGTKNEISFTDQSIEFADNHVVITIRALSA